jgi:hypothetical protein
MKTILGNEIRVRRRHRWVNLLRFPLSEGQAELLVTVGEASIDQSRGIDVTFSPPICEVCGQSWDERTYSCPGDLGGSLTHPVEGKEPVGDVERLKDMERSAGHDCGSSRNPSIEAAHARGRSRGHTLDQKDWP